MPSPEPDDPVERRRELRAGDADRKQTTERLRVALDEGRLDLSEYDERVQQTYVAKTFAELDALVADIPGAIPAEQAALRPADEKHPDESRDRRRDKKKGSRHSQLRQTWTGVGAGAIFFTGLWGMTWIFSGGGPPYYWPVWIIGFWVIGALAATWSSLTKD